MADASDHKTKRVRSPAYPNFDLRAAIKHAQTIYDSEKRNAAPVSVIAKHCGYDITSSAGLRLVAALKQFGLVSEQGTGDDRHVQLTDRGLDILLAESEDAPERLKAVKAAALSPKIHRKLWDHYEGNLPSDQTLRAFLIRKMEFNDSTVGKFIKEFRSTIAFANLTKSDTISAGEERTRTTPSIEGRGGLKAPAVEVRGLGLVRPANDDPMIDLPVTLPSLNIAIVRVPAKMTELDFATLVNSLNAWKPALLASDEEDEYVQATERFMNAAGAVDDEGDEEDE